MYKPSSNSRQPSLFWDLETMLDSKHPLFKLANMVDWSLFEKSFAPLFCADNGRPPKPIRLMTGLLMLKHLRNVSDEQVVVQFSENAYYQYFCGLEAFSISAPCASSELVHFRHRIGEEGVELILKESIRINLAIEDRKREEYDGHTIDRAKEQARRLYGRTIRILAGDRGYRGQKMSGGTKIMIPDIPKASDSAYMKARKHGLFRKRAGIEPVIGHCKSDHRLGRNFYKGLFGDSINVMLAAAAFNLKRAMKVLLCLFRWGIKKLLTEGQWTVITCNACSYAHTRGF